MELVIEEIVMLRWAIKSLPYRTMEVALNSNENLEDHFCQKYHRHFAFDNVDSKYQVAK